MIYAPLIEKTTRKYLNSTNDSWRVDERCDPADFQCFHTAWRTLRGYEIEDAMSEVASDISAVCMNIIRKG